jgi:cytochrome P450 family 110
LWSDSNAFEDVRQEVLERRETIGGQTKNPEEMVLLRSAIQESMRLSPVVVHLTRHAISPTQVGPFAVAKGGRVLPCMYLAHRNPLVFEHPNRFMHKRFVNAKPEWRHSYFPFGFGNRLCAGMPFALRQMVLITSELIANSTLELVSTEAARPVRNMVLIVPFGGPSMQRVA